MAKLPEVAPVPSGWIVEATRRYIADHSMDYPGAAAFIELLGGLPLYADMGGGVAIRANGELIGFVWDEPQSIQPEADPHLRFLALVAGSQRYPELAALSPQRTPKDRDCPSCGGTGRLLELEAAGIDTTHIRCYCGGTGWLPANVADPPRS
jgi:hypothetical protein